MIVEMPLDGLAESNAIRCAAFAALEDGPPRHARRAGRDAAHAADPPVTAGRLHSVHTAVYTPRERSLMVAGASRAEPFRRHDLSA